VLDASHCAVATGVSLLVAHSGRVQAAAVVLEPSLNRLPAISVRQPFADLIMRGVKDVENRSVAWKLRGRILIHASATFGPDEAAQAKALRRHLGLGRGELYEPVLGAILGTVEIVDAVSEHDSEWFSGPVGLVLRQPERWSAPVPRKGAVGIFYVDEHELAPSRPQPPTIRRLRTWENLPRCFGAC
jgi:hypothetical protein